MTTTPSALPTARPDPASTVHPFARRPVAAVVAVTAAVHLVLAARDGRWFDEALMVAIGRHHLDWGSADQPPVAPLLAALADLVAPGSQWAVRLPAVLATAAAVALAAAIARELGGDRRAQVLAASAQATGWWAALAGHWLTPYTLETAGWAATCWLLVRWLRARDDRLLVALGVVVGVAAETKFQVLLLGVVLVASVAVCGPRELLRRRALWAGAGLAALVAAPTLVWQAQHGWPQLAMGPVVAAEADDLYGGRVGVAVGTVLVAGALGAPLAVYGTVRLVRDRGLRFLGVTTVVLFVLFAVLPGRPYYLVGLVPLLAAAGAIGLQRRREAGRRPAPRWVALPVTVLAVVVAVAVTASGLWLSVQLSDPATPRAIATTVARARAALPPEQAARTVTVGQTYLHAVYVDSFAAELGTPPASSPNRSYGYFPPPPESDDAALWVGTGPAPLDRYFTSVREVAAVPGADPTGTVTRVWLMTGRTAPWAEVWDRTRSLSVG